MLRFFGLAWDRADACQSADAQSLVRRLQLSDAAWEDTFSVEGFRVLAAGTRAAPTDILRLPDDSGVIVGALFRRSRNDATSHRVAQIDAGEARRIIASGGRRLVESYWGSYIAFIYDRPTANKWVLRAPRSPLTCFGAALRGLQVYFSRTEDAAALNQIPMSVDWRHVAICVVYGSGGTRGSALREVSEIKPGECVEHRRDAIARKFYWNPLSIANSEPLESVTAASAATRDAVRDAVHALTSSHEAIVHKLSGGLDSSIVACCLGCAPSRPRVVCINDYSAGPDSDERMFARLAAVRANCELVERARDPALKFEAFLDCVRTAVPSPQFLELAHDRPAIELALASAATAVTTGVQGDATFYMQPAGPAAADFVARHGIRAPLARIALDMARLDRTSIWPVLAQALQYRFSQRLLDYWGVQRQFLEMNPGKAVVNVDVLRELAVDDALKDPWFKTVDGTPPGKMWQIFQMTSASAYENSFSRPEDPEFVHPLMAQPVAETCLRIPTYTHLTNGWDRAVARLAFAEDLPAQIRLRTTKGGLEEYAKEVTMRNIEFVRQILLDGTLVQHRILNRPVLEQALSGEPTKTSVTAAMLLIYLGVEVWIHSWQERGARRVAA